MKNIAWLESIAQMTDLEIKEFLKTQPVTMQKIYQSNDYSEVNALFENSTRQPYKNTVFQL